MSSIKTTAIDIGGNEIEVRYEAPQDDKGRTAVAYLKASGKTYVHPMYAFAKQVGAPEESIRPAHRGLDGQGNEGVSDQRWIFELAEAAELEKTMPDRLLRVG